MSDKKSTTGKPRKTLIQLQTESQVADPSAHARRQVAELDKTAKRSLAKRKTVTETKSKNQKELAHLDAQIASLKARYDPLCEHLEESKKRRAEIVKTLQQCKQQEKQIMNLTQGIVFARRIDDSKFQKKMASDHMETLRGYNLKPESTFHQSRGSHSTTGTSTLPKL